MMEVAKVAVAAILAVVAVEVVLGLAGECHIHRSQDKPRLLVQSSLADPSHHRFSHKS